MRQRLVAGISLYFIAVSSQSASFVGLGDLAGDNFYSAGYSVSDDGSTVVGVSSSTSGSNDAFRWTSAGMVGLGGFASASYFTYASSVSGDGSVAVGWSRNGGSFEAVKWTSADGLVGLGDLPGGSTASQATGISTDGSVIVGAGNSGNGEEAFRWTSAGMVGLGGFAGSSVQSYARATSADGSVVVGQAHDDSFGNEAFRWTSAGGMVSLGHLPPTGFGGYSEAWDVSADGAVVVGINDTGGSGRYAFRWTAGTGMVGLGDFSGGGLPDSHAFAVSGDGSTVVGKGRDSSGVRAFVWTQADGMRFLSDLLTERGVTSHNDWIIEEAHAISADGNWVTGVGFRPGVGEEAFLANIAPVPMPAAVWLLGSALGVLGWMRRKAC